MTENFVPYGGLANVINSLNSDDEIKVFLTRYKQWYIKTHGISKHEAEERVVLDLKYFFCKFIQNKALIKKISNVVNKIYSYQV